jgi:hypothetical protein
MSFTPQLALDERLDGKSTFTVCASPTVIMPAAETAWAAAARSQPLAELPSVLPASTVAGSHSPLHGAGHSSIPAQVSDDGRHT